MITTVRMNTLLVFATFVYPLLELNVAALGLRLLHFPPSRLNGIHRLTAVTAKASSMRAR